MKRRSQTLQAQWAGGLSRSMSYSFLSASSVAVSQQWGIREKVKQIEKKIKMWKNTVMLGT
jgi:hypothetical protein